MLIARRNLMRGIRAKPSIDYVLDGLLEMWDATWNAGIGVHDSVNRCVSLASRKDIILPADSTLWDNRIDFASSQASVARQRGEYDVLSQGYTFEIVVRKQTTGNIFKLNTGTSGVQLSRTRTTDTLCLLSTSNVYGGHGSAGSSYVYFSGINDTISISAVVDIQNGKTKLYSNGVLALTLNSAGVTGDQYYPAFADFCFGGTDETVYTQRIYLRPLSDAEVMVNYEIDKERFGLQ